MSNTVNTPGQDALQWDPPAGDIALDELYPGGASPTTAQPQAQPPATTQPETFVYTYKTRDEAERGIAHKDTVIEDQKRRIAELEGRTGQTAQPAPPAGTPADNRTYLQRVQDAVKRAVEGGDQSEYENVQRQFIFDALGPAVPIFMENARALAVNQVEEEVPGFKQFLRSQEFQKVKDTFPELKVAIDGAEGNLAYTSSLPGLYRVAHAAFVGLNAKELAKQAPSVQTPAAPQQAAAPRPTLTSSISEPPAPATPPDMNTAEGRKAIIEAMEKKGVQNTPIKW